MLERYATRPAGCRGCPADTVASGFIPPSGPSDARLAIVGQGPGADEAALGEPFVGPSGRHLSRWLARAGIPRERCAISNVVWCHLPKNRKPAPKELAHCWAAHVGPHLRSLPALRVIAAVGLPAAQRFIPRAKASTVGTVQRIEDPPAWVVPIVHPAAIIRGAWSSDPAQPRYLRRAWDIAIGDDPVLPDITAPPPGGRIARSAEDVALFATQVIADRATVACDIEGTGGVLIGIGFARMDTLEAMYVPFRDRAAPYWPTVDDTRTAAFWVDRLLADPLVGKVFHNGASFDIPFLEGIGFDVAGYVDDTMVRAWATYHEMEKSLQSLAILYCGLSAWKHTSHVGDEGEGK